MMINSGGAPGEYQRPQKKKKRTRQTEIRAEIERNYYKTVRGRDKEIMRN